MELTLAALGYVELSEAVWGYVGFLGSVSEYLYRFPWAM